MTTFLLVQAAPANAGTPPAEPTELGMEQGVIPCVVGPDRPFVFTRTPHLRARVSAGAPGFLDTGFRVVQGSADKHTWDGTELRTSDIPYGLFAGVTVREGMLKDGRLYTWHMWAENSSGRAWSKLCEFEVDSVPPGEPAVSSAEYPEAVATPGVGRVGTFVFAANGSADVSHYEYTFSGEETGPWSKAQPGALGGPASVTWAPAKPGTHYLLVRSFDRAGNRSPVRWYEIRVQYS